MVNHIRPVYLKTAAIGLCLAGIITAVQYAHKWPSWLRPDAKQSLQLPNAAKQDQPAPSPEPMTNSKMIRYLSQISFDAANSNGLVAAFTGAEVRFEDGTVMAIQPSQLLVPDNAVTYVMLTLHDFRLHAFPKNIHRGGIPIAKITAKNGTIQVTGENVYRLPVSRIPHFLQKLQSGEPTKVAVIGDSFELRFDNPTIQVDQFTAAGQTVHYGMALLGSDDDTHTPSPLLQNGYDLAIVGFGTHRGSQSLQVLESMVMNLRRSGVEVILLTENPAKDQKDFLSAESNKIAEIAEHWAAEVADTWSFVSEKMINGDNLFASRLQLNQEGYKIWEEAVRSLMSTMTRVPSNNQDIVPNQTNHSYGTLALTARNTFHPLIQTGEIVTAPIQDSDSAASLKFGGNQPRTTYRLSVGDKAQYTIPERVMGMDLIVEDQSSYEAVLIDAGGKEFARVTNDNPHNRMELLEALAVKDSGYDIQNPITVQVTRGELQLVGISSYVDGNSLTGQH